MLPQRCSNSPDVDDHSDGRDEQGQGQRPSGERLLVSANKYSHYDDEAAEADSE
jgi:hypothetical protein